MRKVGHMTINQRRFASFNKKQIIIGMAEKNLFCILFLLPVIFGRTTNAGAANECFTVSTAYSGALELQTITVDFCDEWFLHRMINIITS